MWEFVGNSLTAEPQGYDIQDYGMDISSRVMLHPKTSQSIQPLPYMNFNLFLKISPTTLSYTSNQLLVAESVLRTLTPLT